MGNQKIQISLDNGATWIDAPQGVRVMYIDIPLVHSDEEGDLEIKVTHEGVILDVYTKKGDLIGTQCQMAEDVISSIISAEDFE